MSTMRRTQVVGTDRLRESALARDLNFLLARANALALAAANSALAEHGLKARSYSVLALAADGMLPTQRELAEFLRLDPSQVVAIVDDLEKRKLVERCPDPTDRRANVVVATTAGRAAFARARKVTQTVEAAMAAAVGPDDLERLGKLMRLLAFRE